MDRGAGNNEYSVLHLEPRAVVVPISRRVVPAAGTCSLFSMLHITGVSHIGNPTPSLLPHCHIGNQLSLIFEEGFIAKCHIM